MHKEHTGMHRNAREHTRVHESAHEIRIMSDKGHHKRPIKSQTSTHLPSAVVVAAVLFLVLFLRRLFG